MSIETTALKYNPSPATTKPHSFVI